MKYKFRLLIKVLMATILFAASFTFAMFQGDQVSWFLFFSYLPIYLYEMGMLFYPLTDWKITRTVHRHQLQAGDTVRITMQIKRKLPYPLFYCLVEEVVSGTLNRRDAGTEKYQDLSASSLIYRRMKRLLFPAFKRHIEFEYVIDGVPRGVHELEAVRVEIGDIFGVVKRNHVFFIHDEIIVYPKEKAVETIRVNDQLQEGKYTHLQRADGANIITGVRQYIAGDRMSMIDWKQTARKRELMTKEFEQEVQAETIIVFDGLKSGAWNYEVFEASLEVMLYLVREFAKAGEMKCIVIGKEVVNLGVEGDYSLHTIKEYFTRLTVTDNDSFGLKLSQLLVNNHRIKNVFVITTRLDQALFETARQAIQTGKSLQIYYIQSKQLINEEVEKYIEAFQKHGVQIVLITEELLGEAEREVTQT